MAPTHALHAVVVVLLLARSLTIGGATSALGRTGEHPSIGSPGTGHIAAAAIANQATPGVAMAAPIEENQATPGVSFHRLAKLPR